MYRTLPRAKQSTAGWHSLQPDANPSLGAGYIEFSEACLHGGVLPCSLGCRLPIMQPCIWGWALQCILAVWQLGQASHWVKSHTGLMLVGRRLAV